MPEIAPAAIKQFVDRTSRDVYSTAISVRSSVRSEFSVWNRGVGRSNRPGQTKFFMSSRDYRASKKEQLGIDPGTAAHRLLKDLLFDFVLRAGHRCHQCGGEMERENFSIEHKIPWLHSDDPKGLFFDLENIAYSHLKCNIAVARKTNKVYADAAERSRATFARYYARHSDKILARKEARRQRQRDAGVKVV